MDASTQALHSFLDEDEEWVDSWKVSAIGSGWDAAMPGMTDDETIGLTDRRLLWLDENLETIPRDQVESVSTHVVDTSQAPWLVRAGGAALVFGALGSAGLRFGLSVPLQTALMPVVVGLVVFLGAIGFARARKQTGEELMQHRMQINAGSDVVTVWGDEDVVNDLAATLDPDGDDATTG